MSEAVCSTRMMDPSNVSLAISHPIILSFLHIEMMSWFHSLIQVPLWDASAFFPTLILMLP